MKKSIFVLSSLVVIIVAVVVGTALAAEKIVKTGEDRVDVIPSRTMTDTTGNSVEVWSEDSKTIYRQKQIDEQLGNAQDRLGTANALDSVKYKADLIAKIQAEMDRLNLNYQRNIDMQERRNLFRQEDFDRRLNDAQDKLNAANALDPTQYKTDLINSIQTEIDRLDLIQAEMNKK